MITLVIRAVSHTGQIPLSSTLHILLDGLSTHWLDDSIVPRPLTRNLHILDVEPFLPTARISTEWVSLQQAHLDTLKPIKKAKTAPTGQIDTSCRNGLSYGLLAILQDTARIFPTKPSNHLT